MPAVSQLMYSRIISRNHNRVVFIVYMTPHDHVII